MTINERPLTNDQKGDRVVNARLILADGTFFEGLSLGAEGTAIGEAVFNTALTGYQEILTDPSYHFQLVVMTCPQIGNYGVNPEDFESRRIYAGGFIIREPTFAGQWCPDGNDHHFR
jgi:carbamoyl-phosphate synthase small subunit